MTRLSWAGLGALTLTAIFGCGSGESRSGSSKDAGADGKVRTDGGGGTSTTKDSGGGTGGQDASSVDAAPPPDTTAPTFAGAKSVTALSEDKVSVGWDAADDDQTPPTAIAYRVYRASSKGQEDFRRARRCADPVADAGPIEQADLPCYVTAAAGATSAIVRDVVPAHTFYYVVRAIDASGNEDTNTIEVAATTPDKTAPDFGGVREVVVKSATSITVTWGAGWDLAAGDPQLSFDVFVTAGGKPDPTKDTPAYTSKPGEHSTLISGLEPLTTYGVLVRAADTSGNVDGNVRILSATTPEGIAPTFGGIRRASPEGNGVRIFWAPATDNVTDVANIMYDVYESPFHDRTLPHKENFSTPSYTSAPGASSIFIPEPNAGTLYFFVVRARDAAGNRDNNITEAIITTAPLPDAIPPVFNGAVKATASSPTAIDLSWNAASDNLTPGTEMLYAVYASTSTTMPATPTLTIKGAKVVTLGGLQPGSTYNFALYALDALGNQSKETNTATAVTLPAVAPVGDAGADKTAPTTGGNPTAVPSIPIVSRVDVSWPPATDDTYGAADIRYHVCVSQQQTDCQGASFVHHVVATTAWGAASRTATILSLTPRTTYYVFVRAEDRAGNLEAQDHFVQVVTSTSWSKNVLNILFDRCGACHSYDKPTTMINVTSSYAEPGNYAACGGTIPGDAGGCQLKLIDPKRPQYSLIYRRVNPVGLAVAPFSAASPNAYDGLEEPRDTPTKLSGEEDDILLDWITQGALAN